ncbi:alpha/beta hydrolase fold protein [Kribbella flavida DSM 17836]|uniref:Alpha/beta hydrolase fold protein n=1 Tax=Kribbella flavida (strain DSM 17836 / JCM 10339 / NBRC 14399) TaxID=479435 RepID=D2PQU1_KRIFD|nr:haloalkane dehalogenase [Kribbella flavida]ADB31074.1 alpha/beta hydrolase fold protein [Kribbella flavida DSM 17836]
MTAETPQLMPVLDLRLGCRTVGEGRPVVFVHGNPTSSYLWRNVMSSRLGRCLAVDLPGMGASDPVSGTDPRRYRFTTHQRYFDAFLHSLRLDQPVVLVGHDWGGVLATDWARRHPDEVAGVAYLETLVAPVAWDSPNAPSPDVFRPLRSEAGERLVLVENIFIEQILQAGTLRPLDDEDLAAYRRPYLEAGESRRPMLTWAREIPIDGEPADVHELVGANARWMATSAVPKLFVNGSPGALLTGPLRDLCRGWPGQQEVTVAGSHFLPEDSPAEIQEALAEWIPTLN